jgi:murein DD-endopeptidase MepM/ murein hydrolase activator NlpD
MARIAVIALVSVVALVGQTYAQEVFVARDTSARPAVAARPEREKPPKELPNEQVAKAEPAKEQFPKAEPVKEQLAKAPPVKARPAVAQPVKEIASVPTAKPQVPKAQPEKAQPAVVENVKTPPMKVALVKAQQLAQPSQSLGLETAFTKLANGFDFPVGKPDAQGYYKARGFRAKGHLGEDWDGVRGGDTDLGDPIYSIGDGIVVFARDCHMGWGNVVILRHTYREGGEIKNIDSLYGHLNSILVRRGQAVGRGQQVGTMGTAHGLYDAHLHLEIRKNLEIGMSRAKFARDFSNYYDPSQFIQSHRHLQTSEGRYKVALNTFTYDSKINWAKAKNYSSYHGGNSESAAALKKAVASQESH